MYFNDELNSIAVNYRWTYLSYADALRQAQPVKAINRELAQRIGQAYDALPRYSSGAAACEYAALAAQVKLQADFLRAHGYDFAVYRGEGEPYANSKAMRHDLKTQRVIYIKPTTDAFGSEPFEHHFDYLGNPLRTDANPLLRWTTYGNRDQPILVNDLFRWVHDVFGHGIRAHEFGPVGEENAYREHRLMFSDIALGALTTETRGTNSWFNFVGDGVRFTYPKCAVLPEWAKELYK